MAFCRECGSVIHNDAAECSHCGATQSVKKTSSVNDDGSLSWGLLGFCVPIVGLVLYLVWKEDQPNNAKMAGKGALISTIISLIISIIYVVLLAIFFDQFFGDF